MVFSHHHPDHTVNAALFPAARIHDHWAVYDGDLWITRDAEGTELSPSIRLIATPGHTDQDISTVAVDRRTASTCARTPGGGRTGPADDPFSPDQAALAREPAADPGHRLGDHPRPRARVHARAGHPALTAPGRPRAVRPRRP